MTDVQEPVPYQPVQPFLREHKRAPMVSRDGLQAWLADEIAWLESIDRTQNGDGALAAYKSVARVTEGIPDHTILTTQAERTEAALAAALAREARLREENARLTAYASQRHDEYRESQNIIHTMTYPEADADLVDAVANKISCGETAGDCDYGHVEHDTNAHVCSREDRADEPLGCRWVSACQLRDLAKALRAKASGATP